MDYRIDQQALGSIAGLAAQLPTLHAPVPPELAGLADRLSMPAPGVALGVPAGCHTPLTRDLMERLMRATLPQVSLVAGLPTLGTLANLHYLATIRLGFPLPNSAALLADLMQQLDLRALSAIARMPWGPLSRLAMLVNIGALLRTRLGIDPGQADAPLRIAEQVPHRVPAFGVTQPPIPTPQPVLARLGYILQLRQLFALSESLGVTLGEPGGLPSLAARLRALLGVRFPVLDVMPSLLPNLHMMAQINQVWPLADLAMDVRPFRAHIAALLRLPVPPLPSCLGPAMPADPARMVPPMPTPETIEQILGTDLEELARANWKIPETVPVGASIPGLNALALLQEMGPVLKPVP